MNTDLLLDRFFAMIAVAALTVIVGELILNWIAPPPRPPKGP